MPSICDQANAWPCALTASCADPARRLSGAPRDGAKVRSACGLVRYGRTDACAGSRGARRRRHRRIDRLAQRHVTRIPTERRAHAAGDVGIAQARVGIGKAHGPAGPRSAERAGAAAEPPGLAWLRKAKGELHFAFQAFVEESELRGDGRGSEQVERLCPQPQLASSVREDSVRVRNPTCGADAAAGGHFEIASIDSPVIATLPAGGRRDPFAFLAPDVVVSPAHRAELDSGQTVVRVLPGRDGFLSLIAIVCVDATADRLLAWSRSVEALQKGKYVPEIGRFSVPPRVEDVQGLTIDAEDIDALQECRPGRCGLKLSDEEIDRVQAARDRSDVEALFRQFLVERATVYSARGDADILPHHDHKLPVRPQDAFATIVSRLEFFPRNLAGYAEYLRGYPETQKADGRESFLYWSKETLGMKPIISITHFSAKRFNSPGMPDAVVVAKQIYATHYKDAALTVTALTGDPSRRYLVYVHRSQVDAFGGVFGGLVRRVVERRVKSEAPGVLLGLRKRLASGEPPNGAVPSR